MKNSIFVKLAMIISFLFSIQIVNGQGIKGVLNKVKTEVEKEAEKIKRKIDEKTNQNNESSSKTNEADKNTPSVTPFYFENQLKIESPNKNDFISLEIQTHKGLPRFGVLNTYGFIDKSEFDKLPRDTKSQILEKRKLEKVQYETYYNLVDLNFMESLYNKMDRSILSIPYSSDPEINDSFKAQNHLKSLALRISTTQTKNKFFCNPERGDCEATEFRIKREDGGYSVIKSGIGSDWGGTASSAFSQQNKFSEFVKTHLPTLQTWSEDLWENNSLTAYVVVQISSGVKPREYDFKNQGYWIRLDLGLNLGLYGESAGKDNYFVTYQPVHDFEQKRLENYNPRENNIELFYKISPEKAEIIMKENNGLLKGYAVYKTKISFSSISDQRHYQSGGDIKSRYVNYVFNIENPIVELFKDEGLSEKFGEISIAI